MKIEKYFKSPSYQFVVHEPADSVQQKLQIVFDRNYGQIMFDIRYNIYGRFTNAGRSMFKISQAGSIKTSGIGPYFNGKISPIDKLKTEIILTPGIYISAKVSWLLSLVVGILSIYFVVVSDNPLSPGTLFPSVGMNVVLFILIKVRQLQSDGLIEDFEKVLQGVRV